MNYIEYILKITLSIVMGIIIGYEREKSYKDAGIKTNMLVCLGACIFTILSYENAIESSDPTRMAAQIISGIGFLGAGAIIKNNLSAKGLTTASIIWISAAIGTSIGFGYYILPIMATALFQIFIFIIKKVEKYYIRGKKNEKKKQ